MPARNRHGIGAIRSSSPAYKPGPGRLGCGHVSISAAEGNAVKVSNARQCGGVRAALEIGVCPIEDDSVDPHCSNRRDCSQDNGEDRK